MAAREPAPREVAVEVDAAGVLASPAPAAVGVEVVDQPGVEPMEGETPAQEPGDGDTGRLVAVDAAYDEQVSARAPQEPDLGRVDEPAARRVPEAHPRRQGQHTAAACPGSLRA